ncbi:MAG: carboxypeptidase regulatory-like domain-containing protein [Candidatus Hydrogenedentes bacterium]|nr:carboxypeptidase regulatory-like domain-containing protein [Candidatus Hydrogenedentota bacterium]
MTAHRPIRGPAGIPGRWLLCGAACCLAAMAAAADHTTYVVALPGANRDTLAAVEALGGVIDHFDGREARAYIHADHWERFQAAGLPHAIVEVQPRDAKALAEYPSYAAIGDILAQAAEDHPDIVRLFSLGRSVQGREIWAILITDQPDVEEDEPEFAYISTLHGDEPVGTVLCLNFLSDLLAGYGNDPGVTDLVNETAIWLVPLANPDGYTLGIRWNANNVDLNRAFPEFSRDFTGTVFDLGAPDTAGRQPEVAHLMRWTAEQSLVLGANYHTGALLVNYPYDEEPGIPSGSDAPTPDDPLMRDISSAYAERNPPMFNSPAFPGGVSNGSAWYSISGGMQDWQYRYAGMVNVTLEVSNIKAPASAALAGLWEENRAAMFAYLDLVHRGARGVVTDRVSGAPLHARVLVDDNPQPVFTDSDAGDYHRMLLPGTYTLRVEAPGYIPFVVRGVTVDGNGATRADAALSTGDVNRDGDVNAADLQLVINAVLELNNLPDADVDGGGVGATDVQHLVNRVLRR